MKPLTSQVSTSSKKVVGALPRSVRCLAAELLSRARDTEPEEYSKSYREAVGAQPVAWGWLPLLTLTSTLGTLSVAYAFTDSRFGGAGLTPFFLAGLLLMFIPTMVRLLSPAASRFERLGLLCETGMYFYLVKVMSSPLYFSFYDEFLHWRTADDIAKSGHLFSENALLPVSSYYPGLEIVTNAVSTLSGSNTFTAGLIVIGVARLLMILAFFLLCEQVLKSTRIASIATMLYMANPHFLLFDAQFGYESLALPLVAFVMFVLAPHQNVSVRLTRLNPIAPLMRFVATERKELNGDMRWITLTAWITVTAIVLTHHVTDFFFDGLLLCWTVTYACMRLTSLRQSGLAKTTLLAMLISIASIVRPGNPVVDYLSSFLADSLDELRRALTGGGGRQLFVTYTGQPTPVLERVLTISSVAVIMLCLPFGLLCLWQRYRSNALGCTLGIISLAYPVSQAFRFTNTGSELTDRAAAFLFIPIAAMLAIFIVQFWPTRRLNWKQITLITSVISLVFLGGTILGSGPSSALLPGPYEVIADTRSIEPEGIQAAIWACSGLEPDNRMATDRINQILMGAYGKQRIVSIIEDKIDVSPVFLSPHLGPDEVSILQSAQARYLVVDRRLIQALPLLGYYYEQAEFGAYQHTTPMSPQAFAKFGAVPQINRVFDSGNIVIYDVEGFNNAHQKA